MLALARRGPTIGVDSNPITAILARANGRLLAPPPAVQVSDVTTLGLGTCDAWHIDPDRRPQGRRTTQVELHEPDAAAIAKMLRQNPHAAIKLAPAAELPDGWAEQAELEWISRDGECRQLVVWFGALTSAAGTRRATVLGKTAEPESTVADTVQEVPPATHRVARYVYEPDAAMLAAGLTGTVAAAHRLAPITHGIAYLTSDERHATPALAAFEVCEVLPLDLKKLKSALRARGIGRLEIKKRGIEEDIERLRRQLDLRGDEAATLLLLKVAGHVTAIVARRLDNADPSH